MEKITNGYSSPCTKVIFIKAYNVICSSDTENNANHESFTETELENW